VGNWFRRWRSEHRGGSDGSEGEPSPVVDGTITAAALATVRAHADAGDPEAMANLGAHFYQIGDHIQGISWTERAWSAGNLNAGFNLGTFYLNSGDTHRADLIWTQAAERGDADAMMCVARLALGRGDEAVADKWRERILVQDQPYPITALGVAYRDHADPITAMRIFARSIALGDAYAMEYAARIHELNGDISAARQLRTQAAQSTRFGWGLIESGHAGPSEAG